jgi:three-Cys-motif partner protein
VNTDDSLYAGREQSQVKHEVLARYLRQFAQKIYSYWQSITYIDGFSGPWNSVSSDLRDSSFAIAVNELRTAQQSFVAKGKSVRVRCFFVEEDPGAHAILRDYAAKQGDLEIETRNLAFEDAIPDILRFIRRDAGTFAFTLIDPKGWTGFALERIRPLLEVSPGEVLVNFMTGHIIRFVEVPAVRPQLAAMFGSEKPLAELGKLSGLDRSDRCVEEYCNVLMAAGGFQHVSPAIVLQPTRDRPHFHLIYGTRKAIGLKVFKDAERKAMELMEKARAVAEQRMDESDGQLSLFDPKGAPPSPYYDELRRRYLSSTFTELERQLRQSRRVLYDDLWAGALKRPLVWESDLKAWIAEYRKKGFVEISGLKGKARVPNRESSHFIVWTKD